MKKILIVSDYDSLCDFSVHEYDPNLFVSKPIDLRKMFDCSIYNLVRIIKTMIETGGESDYLESLKFGNEIEFEFAEELLEQYDDAILCENGGFVSYKEQVFKGELE